MKKNALSYIIRYLPCLLCNFKQKYIKTYFEQNALSPQPYLITKFHSYNRELALLERFLLIITITLLLIALEES